MLLLYFVLGVFSCGEVYTDSYHNYHDDGHKYEENAVLDDPTEKGYIKLNTDMRKEFSEKLILYSISIPV